jgi:hypothetical protein
MTNDKFCLTRIENEVRTKLNALAEKDCRSSRNCSAGRLSAWYLIPLNSPATAMKSGNYCATPARAVTYLPESDRSQNHLSRR